MPTVITAIIIENRNQVIPLTGDVCYSETVKKVSVRVRGNERIITPIGHAWDHFFLNGPAVSDDFMEDLD